MLLLRVVISCFYYLMYSPLNLHQMQTLEELKKHFINELVHQDLRRVFYILRQNIDNQCNKYDDLNLLHARYITASHDQNIKGILSSEDARIIFNQLNASLLDFINNLTDEDLNLKPSAATVSIPTQVKDIIQKTTCNKGKILYKVPSKMELKKERKCIVRIAFDEKELEINDLQSEGPKVEPIRIAEVMEVQFIDQCKDDAFNIRTLSSSEQLVDRGDFTEWIFYVEPLLQGVYDLLLKVSVIEKRLGREIRKDIVMEKKIEVVANPVDVNDSLGNYANSESKMAIGAGFAIPAGFEVWDQPVILDSFFIPPLDPGANLSPPASPYSPPNHHESIGWLTFASVVLLLLVVHFSGTKDNSTNNNGKGEENEPILPITHFLTLKDSTDLKSDALLLTVKGNQPPYKLTLNKESYSDFSIEKKIYDSESNQFAFTSLGLTQGVSEKFKAILTDSKDSLITSDFFVYWKIPGEEENIDTARIQSNSLKITALPSSDKKSLGLEISNGYLPFQMKIINENNPSEHWPFSLIKATDTTLLLQSLKEFPKDGNFIVEVVDANNKSDNDYFSMTSTTRENKLTLNVSLDEKSKTLKSSVIGDYPPFKVFFNETQIATLKKVGSHQEKYVNSKLINNQLVKVMVKDNIGKTKTVSVNIPCGSVITNDIINCFYSEKKKGKCSILYVYEEKTNDNWKMQSQTFSDCNVIENINKGNFEVYRMNKKSISKNCDHIDLTDLESVATFIYQGNNKKPITLKGFINSDKLLSSLICHPPPSTTDPPVLTDKGDGIKKSLMVQLDSVKTYKYHTFKGDNISIEKQQTETWRVQIISFSKEDYFDEFIKKFEDNKDITEPLYIRLEDGLIKVFLGNYKDQEKEKAEILLKKLKKYLTKNNLVPDQDYLNFMKVIKN